FPLRRRTSSRDSWRCRWASRWTPKAGAPPTSLRWTSRWTARCCRCCSTPAPPPTSCRPRAPPPTEAGPVPSTFVVAAGKAGRRRYSRPSLGNPGRGRDSGMDPDAGLGGLCRPAVRGGLVGRPPAALSQPAVAAAAGVFAGAGGVLLVLDLLWRGRHRRQVGPGLPADLPGADPAVRVRLAHPR